MIATGTHHHAVSLLKVGNNLFIGNRGEGFTGSAVEIYPISDVDRFVDRLIDRIWRDAELGLGAELRGSHSELYQNFTLERTDHTRAV